MDEFVAGLLALGIAYGIASLTKRYWYPKDNKMK